MKRLILILTSLGLFIGCVARPNGPLDTTSSAKPAQKADLRLVTRLHSLGQFSYGGRIVTDNPVMDFNFTYDRKNWGFQLFKAMDLRDAHTPMNFMLAVVNKNFRLGKRLTVTPNAGIVLEQLKGVADHGSDAAFILTTSYKISREFTIDQSMLFANLVLEPVLRDWVSRMRLLYSTKHIDLIFACWYNNRVFDTTDYATFSASASYSRIKIVEHVKMNIGVTGFVVAHTSDEEAIPAKNGVYLTLAVVLD